MMLSQVRSGGRPGNPSIDVYREPWQSGAIFLLVYLSFLGHLSWQPGEFPDLPGDPVNQDSCLEVCTDIFDGIC